MLAETTPTDARRAAPLPLSGALEAPAASDTEPEYLFEVQEQLASVQAEYDRLREGFDEVEDRQRATEAELARVRDEVEDRAACDRSLRGFFAAAGGFLFALAQLVR